MLLCLIVYKYNKQRNNNNINGYVQAFYALLFRSFHLEFSVVSNWEATKNRVPHSDKHKVSSNVVFQRKFASQKCLGSAQNNYFNFTANLYYFTSWFLTVLPFFFLASSYTYLDCICIYNKIVTCILTLISFILPSISYETHLMI